MATGWKTTLFLAIFAIVVFTAGCRAKSAAPETPGGRIVRSADAAVAEPMRPYFAAGLGLLVLGGLAAIAGAKTAGLAAMALGGAVTAIGVVIVQYPWAVLLAFLLAVGVAGAALFDRWRTKNELVRNRSALAATAQVIQNLPEGKAIKQGLADLGSEVEERVREVVTPIKDRLRREGKIGGQAREGV